MLGIGVGTVGRVAQRLGDDVADDEPAVLVHRRPSLVVESARQRGRGGIEIDVRTPQLAGRHGEQRTKGGRVEVHLYADLRAVVMDGHRFQVHPAQTALEGPHARAARFAPDPGRLPRSTTSVMVDDGKPMCSPGCAPTIRYGVTVTPAGSGGGLLSPRMFPKLHAFPSGSETVNPRDPWSSSAMSRTIVASISRARA